MRKSIESIFLCIVVSGCVATPKYVEPTEGPESIMRIEKVKSGSISLARILSGSVSFAIENENGCGLIYETYKFSKGEDYVSYKIPANKNMFVVYQNQIIGYYSTSCLATGYFKPIENKEYIVSGINTKKGCLVSVSSLDGEILTPVKLQHAYIDQWSGKKVCKK